MKAKINLENMCAYLQGKIRYKIYYSKFSWLIREHIKEQIDIRIMSMNLECFNRGECIKCGCQTTALQMANKHCDGNCYPKMLNKREWELFKKYGLVNEGILWRIEGTKFKKL